MYEQIFVKNWGNDEILTYDNVYDALDELWTDEDIYEWLDSDIEDNAFKYPFIGEVSLGTVMRLFNESQGELAYFREDFLNIVLEIVEDAIADCEDDEVYEFYGLTLCKTYEGLHKYLKGE